MRAVRDDATGTRHGRDDEPGRRTKTAPHHHIALLSALAFLLAACGTATPAPGLATAPRTNAGDGTAGTAASPPGATPGTPGGSSSESRASGGAAASRIPILYYRGRRYEPFSLREDTPAAVATPQLDRVVDTTFSRWQSGGSFPAGSAIYSVAGQPVERVLAVQGPDRTSFYRAVDYPSGLERYQVVRGTVISFGPNRWTTSDGQAPPRETRGSAPRDVWVALYTPATIAVERTLHGLIPAGQEIEVRQLSGTKMTATTATAAGGPVVLNPTAQAKEVAATRTPWTSTAGVLQLTPGRTVILLLTPGQWSRDSYMPPGDYYLLGRELVAFAVADGQVTPLGVPDAEAERVPLERFEAGLTETFGGVPALDPHGPRPTPPPPPPRTPPPPTPTPRFAVGQPVNLVREYGLDAAQSLFIKATSVPPASAGVDDPARVRAIVAALDTPLPVVAAPPATRDSKDIAIVFFGFPGRRSIPFEYNRTAGTLTNRDDWANPVVVAAPPDFARTLGLP